MRLIVKPCVASDVALTPVWCCSSLGMTKLGGSSLSSMDDVVFFEGVPIQADS